MFDFMGFHHYLCAIIHFDTSAGFLGNPKLYDPAGVTLAVPERGPEGGKGGRKKKKRRARAEKRKVLFVHVRVNRFHCRITYQARLAHPFLGQGHPECPAITRWLVKTPHGKSCHRTCERSVLHTVKMFIALLYNPIHAGLPTELP